MKPTETEDYVAGLYKELGSYYAVAEPLGWTHTRIGHLVLAHNVRKNLSTAVERTLPEETTSSDLVVTRELGITEARVEFIEMLREGRDGLIQQ